MKLTYSIIALSLLIANLFTVAAVVSHPSGQINLPGGTTLETALGTFSAGAKICTNAAGGGNCFGTISEGGYCIGSGGKIYCNAVAPSAYWGPHADGISYTSGNVRIGAGAEPAGSTWTKSFVVQGTSNSKIESITPNIYTGLYSSNAAVFGAPVGGIVGTRTNHPFSIIVNQVPAVTITPDPNSTEVGIGTTAPENGEGWKTALEIKGQPHSKLEVSTLNVRTGLYSHNSGIYGATAGGIVGTKSNHPFHIMTNSQTRITVGTNGHTTINGILYINDGYVLRLPRSATAPYACTQENAGMMYFDTNEASGFAQTPCACMYNQATFGGWSWYSVGFDLQCT